MAGIMMVVYVLGIVAAAVILWSAVQRRREAAVSERLVPVIHAARRRALIAVLFAATVFLAGMIAGITLPELLGQPFAVTPLIAGAAGMLLYSVTPPRLVLLRDDEPRVARLVPRSAFSAVPVRWATAFLVVIVLFVAVVLLCGLTAGLDEAGRSRVIRFEAHDVASSSSPYPGWFYGVPALGAIALMTVSLVIALRRISTTPAFPHAADAEIDQAWRRTSVEVVLKLGTGAALFSLGGIALIAGLAMGNATIDGSTPLGWSVLATVLWTSGGAALVLSIVSVTLAGLAAITIGEAATTRETVR